ncbi:hypothetical protein Tco_0309945 [Tanacetum coccineum]
MSTRDKSGLGYGNQIHEGVLSYEKKVLESVFDSRSSDVEDSPVNDRFAKVEGMHAVPPPMTGIYMPSKSDFGIDESKLYIWSKTVKNCVSDAKTTLAILLEIVTSMRKEWLKQVELNKQKGKGTSQGENRPVWNNVQRLNHQNKFVPKAVLTKTGIIPVILLDKIFLDDPYKALKTKELLIVDVQHHTGNKPTLLNIKTIMVVLLLLEVVKVAGIHEEKESKFYHLDRHGAECIYYRIFRSDESSRWIKTFSEMVTMFDRLDLEELYNLVMQRFESTTPEVHTLTLEDGTEIHMLAERKYPLTKETLERMMSLKLIAESASESAYNLLSKELASPKQTALGKDISNLLIVDSLLKTIWLSMHHVIAMKHWLFQSKRLLLLRCCDDDKD